MIGHGDFHIIIGQLTIPHHGAGHQFAHPAGTQDQHTDGFHFRRLLFIQSVLVIHRTKEILRQQRIFVKILIDDAHFFIDDINGIGFIAAMGQERQIRVDGVHGMLGMLIDGAGRNAVDAAAQVLIFFLQVFRLLHGQCFIFGNQIKMKAVLSKNVQVGDAALHQQHLAHFHRFVGGVFITAENDIGPLQPFPPAALQMGAFFQNGSVFPGAFVQLGKNDEGFAKGKGKQHGAPEPWQPEEGGSRDDGHQRCGAKHKGNPENLQSLQRTGGGKRGCAVQIPHIMSSDFHGEQLGDIHQGIERYGAVAGVLQQIRLFGKHFLRLLLQSSGGSRFGGLLMQRQGQHKQRNGNHRRNQHQPHQRGEAEGTFHNRLFFAAKGKQMAVNGIKQKNDSRDDRCNNEMRKDHKDPSFLA